MVDGEAGGSHGVIKEGWRASLRIVTKIAGRNNGETFRARWRRADSLGVQNVLVVSWNEWVTGEQPSAEVSKDLEPSLEHGRFYLDLLKEEIEKFKSGSIPVP